ncbi:MAG: hypothetical protein ACRD8Z_01895 [Nitrososphaeraceae archaeon]
MTKNDELQHQIDIILDEDRYQEILEICSNYKAKQGVELTPKEYILMLMDSAIGNETK